jgi:hypothetical protein
MQSWAPPGWSGWNGSGAGSSPVTAISTPLVLNADDGLYYLMQGRTLDDGTVAPVCDPTPRTGPLQVAVLNVDDGNYYGLEGRTLEGGIVAPVCDQTPIP